jgi:glycosyltransferase involved in cell wall biosynthesis
MDDLLSVIVPVYNVKNYLSRCLESIINQTLEKIEIICINDGSTDGSEKILEDYSGKDKRIKVVHQKNNGLSSARNAGIKYATGKYISFVDSDDYLNKECYSLCIPLFKMGIDVVSFSAKVVVEGDYVKQNSDDYYYQVHHTNVVSVTPLVLKDENVSAWNKIYRMDIIKKNNLQFPVGFFYEDAEFYWKYMSFVRKAYFLPVPLYNYVRRRGSIMSITFSGTDKAIDHLKIMDHLFEFWFKNKEFKTFIKSIGAQLFEQYFWFSYRHSTFINKKAIVDLAMYIVNKYDLVRIYPDSVFIQNLYLNKLYKYNEIDEYNLIQKIFSIKKFKHARHIHFLGFRLKIRRKNRI